MSGLSILAEDLRPIDLPPWLAEVGSDRVAASMEKNSTASVDWRILMSIAIDESRTPARVRSVMRVLVSFKPGSSWPLDIIANRSGVSRRSAQRALHDLEEWGWLQRNYRVGRSSTYHLSVPVTQPPDRLVRRPKRPAELPPTQATVTQVNPTTDVDTQATVSPLTHVTLAHPQATVSQAPRPPCHPRYLKGPGDDGGTSTGAIFSDEVDDAC